MPDIVNGNEKFLKCFRKDNVPGIVFLNPTRYLTC
jgi:hypothetical protein